MQIDFARHQHDTDERTETQMIVELEPSTAVLAISCFVGIGDCTLMVWRAFHPSHSAKSWLFTIYMGETGRFTVWIELIRTIW